VFAIVPDNGWKVSFCILSIQYLHYPLGSASCARWLLAKARIEFKSPRDASFELQIIDIPHGQEDLIYGDCFFLEVQHHSQVVQGLLAQDWVVLWRHAIAGTLNSIRFQINLLLSE
jgi:hypothetical protein